MMYQGLRWFDSISNNIFNIKQPYLNIKHLHPSFIILACNYSEIKLACDNVSFKYFYLFYICNKRYSGIQRW